MSNQKPLQQGDVKTTAEALMLVKGQTTTLDVKNQLRQNNFVAFQKEVSNHMAQLAVSEKWAVQQNGQFRVYKLGPDTDESVKTYLEKDDNFWEIDTSKKDQTFALGKVGTDGFVQKNTFPSNRMAIRDTKDKIAKKKAEGFVEAVDKRLDLNVRKQYQKYFALRATKCTLAYFGVEKIETQDATLSVNNQRTNATLIRTKNAGYEFTWDTQFETTAIEKILASKVWSSKQYPANESFLMGEKTIKTKAFNSLGTAIDKFIIEQTQDNIQTELNVDNSKLFKVDIQFANGEKVSLSKFQHDIEKELIPLVKKMLKV